MNCVVYTIFGISHAALLARMTRDASDRNTTSVVSSICNNLSGLVIGTLITYLQLSFGWLITGVILGVTVGILILIPGITIEETVGMQEESRRKAETVPLKEQLMAQMMSIGQLPGIIVLFFMPWFSNKFSKRNFMLSGGAILIAVFILLGFAGTNHTLLLVGVSLRSIGVGPMFAGIYALIADACDYGEWKTGIRSEGLFASSQSIGSKIGIGFGSAVAAWILSWCGYDAMAAVQSEMAVNGIRFSFSWLGAIISAALFFCILFMNVEKYIPQMRAEAGMGEAKQQKK